MSLTPAADDVNRESELERKRKDPQAFGALVGRDLEVAVLTKPETVALNKSRERIDLIVEAIGELDQANPMHFTKGGMPNVFALSELVGEEVTASDRDAAYVLFVERNK